MPYNVGPAFQLRDAPARYKFAYDARAGDVTAIAVSNALLSLATLGLYRFWGKTKLRHYIWSHIEFQGDRLEYSGTPKELLTGFLVVLAILLPLIVASFAADHYFLGNPQLLVAKEVIQLILILILVQFAVYRARRYRLTRTLWRGIRGAQTGSAFKYALRATGWGLVLIVTLGLAYPFYSVDMQRYRTENTWFGDRRFSFYGKGSALFLSWLPAWIPLAVALGLNAAIIHSANDPSRMDPVKMGAYGLGWLAAAVLFFFLYAWYRAKEFRYFAGKTGYGVLQFDSFLSTIRLVLIYLLYFIALAVLIGLVFAAVGWLLPAVLENFGASITLPRPDRLLESTSGMLLVLPMMILLVVSFGVIRVCFYTHPLLRALCDSLTVTGEENYASIGQSRQARPGRGEGLADTLDVGAI